jgi:serine/threonine-protein kinase
MPRVVERCADDVFQLSGHLLEGRYAVHGVVARGGSGVVYKATRLDLGVPVALKVLHIPPRLRGASEDALVERFRVEARILAGLRHHAIVRVYELGALAHAVAPNGGVWMALEWLDGVTLDRDLAARDGLGRSPRAVLALLAPVFDALACVHAQGIAHRDVKPANLIWDSE